MGEYFRGWKRKAGLLTLVMACVLVVGWVRSAHYTDSITFPCGLRNEFTLTSTNQLAVMWIMTSDRSLDTFVPHISMNPRVFAISEFLDLDQVELDWSWNTNLVQIGRSKHLPRYAMSFAYAVIPYWSIVLPLTAISPWLLLSKPNKNTVR